MKKKTISLYTDFNEWRFLSRKLPYKGILEDSGKSEREITQENRNILQNRREKLEKPELRKTATIHEKQPIECERTC